MKKWKLVVLGLLFSMLFGMTAMAETDAVDDVRIRNAGEDHEMVLTGKGDQAGKQLWGKFSIAPWETRNNPSDSPMLTAEELAADFGITGEYKVHTANIVFEEGSLRNQEGSIDFKFDAYNANVWMELSVPGVTKDSAVRILTSYRMGWVADDDMDSSVARGTLVVGDGYVGVELAQACPTLIIVYDKAPDASGDVSSTPASLVTSEAAVKDNETDEEVKLTVRATTENIDPPSSETVRVVTGSSGNYMIHTMDVELLKGTEEYHLSGGQSVELEFQVPGVTSNSYVRILHYDGTRWETDSVSNIRCSNGRVKATFSSLSPIAILVSNRSSGSGSSSGGSGSHSSGGGNRASGFWATPLSAGASVMVNGAAADLQIGPSGRDFSESEAQTILGTTEPCNVYTADLWLLDQATRNIVLPGADGALVTINVPGVTKGSRVMVREWPNESTEYVDLVPEEIGDGYIKVRFYGMGRVAICTSGGGNSAAATTATTAGAENQRLSPKTSEGLEIYAAEAIAVLSLLGFIVFRRKSMMK